MGMVLGKIGVETHAFEVITAGTDYQIRRYSGGIIAETSSAGSSKEADSVGFRRLAKYIGVFGVPENASPEGAPSAIAMTAPVMTTGAAAAIAMTAPVMSSDGGNKMGFVMPSQYTMATIPRPTDPAVTLRELPPRVCAALTFSGTATAAVAAKKAEELLGFLERDGVECHESRAWETARFNPPWTVPFWKTNEVLVALADSWKPPPAAAAASCDAPES